MYGVRVKYFESVVWCRVKGENFIPIDEIGPGNRYDIKYFFMKYADAQALFKQLVFDAGGYVDNYGHREYQYIALVEFNATYPPFSEQAVLDFREFK